MALRAILDADEFESADESLRSFYKESSGSYVLDVEDIEAFPALEGLRNGLRNAKRERGQTRNELTQLKERFGPLLAINDLDLSDIEEDRIEALLPYLKGESNLPTGSEKPDPYKNEAELERIRENARKPMMKEIEKLKASASQWQTLARNEMLTNTLSAEFSRAGVKDPDFLELLIDRYKSRCELEVEDGKASIIVKDTEYGDVIPKEFVKEWSGTDYAKKFIAASDNNGGGATGGAHGKGIKNPWSPEHLNLMEQGRIVRADPNRAQAMAAKYGKKIAS